MKTLILFAVLLSTAHADLANELYQYKLDARAANLKIVKECLANHTAHPKADCDNAVEAESLAQKEDEAADLAIAEEFKQWQKDLADTLHPPATARDIEKALANDRLKASLGQY